MAAQIIIIHLFLSWPHRFIVPIHSISFVLLEMFVKQIFTWTGSNKTLFSFGDFVQNNLITVLTKSRKRIKKIAFTRDLFLFSFKTNF